MSNSQSDHIKHVLETYSTEGIKKIFNKIEAKIENLINASSNDFLKLNNHFKSFYDVVNHISGKSSEVFKEIISGAREKNLKILIDCIRDYEQRA